MSRALAFAALAFVAAFFVLYAVVAFAAWDINPGHWDTATRAFTAFMGCIFGGGAAAATFTTIICEVDFRQ